MPHKHLLSSMDAQFEQERKKIFELFHLYRDESGIATDEYLMSLFRFQYKYNHIYRTYCENLRINVQDVKKTSEIPYLPISAFKSGMVTTGQFEAMEVFKSSGTTMQVRSLHFLRDLDHYLSQARYLWEQYFGYVDNYCFLGLLPGYLERDGSSLISMVNYFIQCSKYRQSGFYLRNHNELHEKLLECQYSNIPTVLFGVSYALLDFFEQFSLNFPTLIIMETGGMKGQRQEMLKEELHFFLQEKSKSELICSEYGMTELMSQAYSKSSTKFIPNKCLKIDTFQLSDPLTREKMNKTGIICVTDFANIDSCAFIQTEDVGILYEDQSFEIAGRTAISDIRGCNLMMEELGL